MATARRAEEESFPFLGEQEQAAQGIPQVSFLFSRVFRGYGANSACSMQRMEVAEANREIICQHWPAP